jgi:hypothetical protein
VKITDDIRILIALREGTSCGTPTGAATSGIRPSICAASKIQLEPDRER